MSIDIGIRNFGFVICDLNIINTKYDINIVHYDCYDLY